MRNRARPPLWLWINLLSLDAPLIALVWQDFLARCYPTLLRPTGRGALGLTVWAIYLADRLLDVRHPASAVESVRQAFYRRHRGFAQTLLAVVVCVDILVTRLWLRPAIIEAGLLLTGGVVAYLGAFPFAGWSATAWKKPLAALLFTSGTFLIAWTGTGQPASRLLWPAAAFCVLCLGNLLMIERWSRPAMPRAPARSREWVSPMLLGACLICAGSPNWFASTWFASAWFAAIMASAAGLIALARWGRKISSDARCVLADAALLTPLLFR